MSRTFDTTVKFRGADREVEFEYEGDGVIVWWFTHDGGEDGEGGATPTEQSDIYQTLWAYLEDWRSAADD